MTRTMKYFYLIATLTAAFAPSKAFAEKSEHLPDIENNLPSTTQHTLRGEARLLQPAPDMICGVNKVWICRGMFSDQCVINSTRLPNLLARTNSVMGKCECNTNRPEDECCQNSDCGDVTFKKCNTGSRKCEDLPCNAATQAGVDCCQASDCGDITFKTCNLSTKKCVDLPCNKNTQAGVECCQASDCGDITFKTCNSSKKCVDLPCNKNTQAGVECCVDGDCISPGFCFDNTCVDEPKFCVPNVGGAQCCEDSDCGDNFDCSATFQCVQRACNIAQPDIECCSNSQCETSKGEICSSNVCVIDGDPRATLIWYGDDELDLHFITPGNEHIYHANMIAANGRLDKDAHGGPNTTALKVENIHFDAPNLVAGESRVYVNNFHQFGGGTPDNWILELHLGNYALKYSGKTPEGQNSPDFKFRYAGPS